MGTKKSRKPIKVLYIGHFHNGTSGWRRAAIDYLLAMDSVGIDVVPRSIKLNDSKPEMPERYLELEKKSSDGCNVVIQHVLPHHLKYDGHFDRNIALCVYESEGLWLHNWNTKINMMDELWVPSYFTKNIFKQSGIVVPVHIVPHTFDLSKYQKTYDKISHNDINGNFKFYTIADLNIRKNLRGIIQAFHLEFTPNEPVSLMVKTTKYGMSAEDTYKLVQAECGKIREGMKLYRNNNMYLNELLITNELTDTEVMELHNTGDCYVNASHGEAWCIPLFDAMAMGKKLVCPWGMYDYIRDLKDTVHGFKMSDIEPCFGANDTFWEIGSSREQWLNCSVDVIGKAMRAAYNDKTDTAGITRLQAAKYSYDNVGHTIKELLNG